MSVIYLFIYIIYAGEWTATSHLSERAYKRYLKKEINFLVFVFKKIIKRVKKIRKISWNEFFIKRKF